MLKIEWHTVLLACVPQFDTMHPSMLLGANFNDRNASRSYDRNQDSKTEMYFRVFFIPNIGAYYSYKIDIVPKIEYNVLESEVYSLCI